MVSSWMLVRRATAWTARALVLVGLAALVWIWFLADWTGQERTMAAVPVAALVGLLIVALLATGRGPRRRLARATAATLVLVIAAGVALFRLEGLTGDFYPVVRWRFSPPRDTMLPALPAALAPEAAPAGEPPAAADPAPDLPAGTGTPVASAPLVARSPADPGAAGTEPPAPAPHPSFPQFLGPERSGVVRGVRLARDWTTRPPRRVWTRAIGAGWSGFAVHGGLAVTQEQRGPSEMVVAYDLLTGEPRWSHADPVRYDTVIAGVGPRATPTISGRRVVTVGATGVLNVLDLDTGRRLWQARINDDNDARDPEWGRSGSPLVFDGRVVVNAGGPDGRSLVAYDLASGARVWSGGTDRAGYASPAVLDLLGRPQIVVFNLATLAGHDPATGVLLWSQPWSAAQPNVAQPIRVAPDLVLASSGYGAGSRLVRLVTGPDGTITPSIVWDSPRLKAKFTNPVLHGGFVYGLDDGVLVCLDVETGERRWKAGRYGHGQTLLAGDVILVTTEDGEVVLVEPTPEAHRELARFGALDGKTWNPPALAAPYLLVRNDRQAALFELPLRE